MRPRFFGLEGFYVVCEKLLCQSLQCLSTEPRGSDTESCKGQNRQKGLYASLSSRIDEKETHGRKKLFHLALNLIRIISVSRAYSVLRGQTFLASETRVFLSRNVALVCALCSSPVCCSSMCETVFHRNSSRSTAFVCAGYHSCLCWHERLRSGTT